jgi:hypothetical protein
MLIDRDGPGDRDKALQLLAEAIAMHRQIGMCGVPKLHPYLGS